MARRVVLVVVLAIAMALGVWSSTGHAAAGIIWCRSCALAAGVDRN